MYCDECIDCKVLNDEALFVNTDMKSLKMCFIIVAIN